MAGKRKRYSRGDRRRSRRRSRVRPRWRSCTRRSANCWWNGIFGERLRSMSLERRRQTCVRMPAFRSGFQRAQRSTASRRGSVLPASPFSVAEIQQWEQAFFAMGGWAVHPNNLGLAALPMRSATRTPCSIRLLACATQIRWPWPPRPTCSSTTPPLRSARAATLVGRAGCARTDKNPAGRGPRLRRAGTDPVGRAAARAHRRRDQRCRPRWCGRTRGR